MGNITEREREQLSAYLDGELSAKDAQQLEAKLAGDSELAEELESLRYTASLIHSLPQVRAPRSYTLDPAVYGQPGGGGLWGWLRDLFGPRRPVSFGLQLGGALGSAVATILILLGLLLPQIQRSMLAPGTGQVAEGGITATAPASVTPAAQASPEMTAPAAALQEADDAVDMEESAEGELEAFSMGEMGEESVMDAPPTGGVGAGDLLPDPFEDASPPGAGGGMGDPASMVPFEGGGKPGDIGGTENYAPVEIPPDRAFDDLPPTRTPRPEESAPDATTDEKTAPTSTPTPSLSAPMPEQPADPIDGTVFVVSGVILLGASAAAFAIGRRAV
jgi:hypothetical protein